MKTRTRLTYYRTRHFLALIFRLIASPLHAASPYNFSFVYFKTSTFSTMSKISHAYIKNDLKNHSIFGYDLLFLPTLSFWPLVELLPTAELPVLPQLAVLLQQLESRR